MTLNRRDFIKKFLVGGFGVAAWGAFPGFFERSAWASAGNGTKVLFCNLNGGLDGLAVLQPSSGALYSSLASLRPTLALNPSGLLSADSKFGFHPNMSVFKDLHDQGKLASVLNLGYLNMTRSHLDAEVAMARGVPDRLSATASGFINRMGSSFGWNSLSAVSVSGADRPFDGGDYRGVQVAGLDNFYFHWDGGASSGENSYRRDMLYSVSQDSDLDSLKKYQKAEVDNLALVIDNADTVKAVRQAASFNQSYPASNMGRQFKDIEILFGSNLGVEVGYMRPIGFDTHSDQANRLGSLLSEFNAAFSVFVNNMKAKGLWNNLIVVVYSEFGRTNVENFSHGTDHGGANTVFLAGGPVVGGIYGEILPADLTDEGWLPMKYNVVELYRRILIKMNYDPDAIFSNPGGNSLAGLLV